MFFCIIDVGDNMNYIPIVLKETKQNIILIGQGSAILEKIEKFQAFANHLIFLCVDNQQQKVDHCEMIYIEPSQWESYFNDLKPRIVIQAGLDNLWKENIYQYCLQHHIEINTVDQPSLCTFIMPVLLEKGKLNISVSTSGASPMMAKLLIQNIGEVIPDSIDAMLDWLCEVRPYLKETLKLDFTSWKILQKELCMCMLKLNRPLTTEELKAFIKLYQKQ